MTDNSVLQKLPLLSIVTVTFNAKVFLEKTLTSLKQQTNPKIEYLIIDGNSTDSTKVIADNYRNIVTTLISENDRGIPDAMNKGLQLCSSQWVLFLNAGGFLNNKQSIKNTVTEITGDADIICSDVICDDGNFIKTLSSPDSKTVAVFALCVRVLSDLTSGLCCKFGRTGNRSPEAISIPYGGQLRHPNRPPRSGLQVCAFNFENYYVHW